MPRVTGGHKICEVLTGVIDVRLCLSERVFACMFVCFPVCDGVRVCLWVVLVMSCYKFFGCSLLA